jgi:NAD(P)-dependent dehydrogenase (short-subunit alcohol dehydrogenase family)
MEAVRGSLGLYRDHSPERRANSAILVVGASKGIGAATAKAAAAGTACVIVAARNLARCVEITEEIGAAGGGALPLAMDVHNPDSVEQAFAFIRSRFMSLDAVVVNAAMLSPERVDGSDPGLWRACIETNLIGAYFVARAALPLLENARAGRILFVSSDAANEIHAGWSAYSASKAGLEVLAKVLAWELHGSRVKSVIVRPGIVNTDMHRIARDAASRARASIPPEKVACPMEVGAAIAQLCDPGSILENGTTIHLAQQLIPQTYLKRVG